MARPMYHHRISLYTFEDGTAPALWVARKPGVDLPSELLSGLDLPEGKYNWGGSGWVHDPETTVHSIWNPKPRAESSAGGATRARRPSRTLPGAMLTLARDRFDVGLQVPRKDMIAHGIELGFSRAYSNVCAAQAIRILLSSGEASRIKEGKRVTFVKRSE